MVWMSFRNLYLVELSLAGLFGIGESVFLVEEEALTLEGFLAINSAESVRISSLETGELFRLFLSLFECAYNLISLSLAWFQEKHV